MKKGLKFTKDQLERLYLKQKLSLAQIGEKFGCNGSNVLYWLKKFDIKRRPACAKKVDIPPEVLEDLYWNKGMTTAEIASMYDIKHGRSVLKKLHKFGIKTKTVSEALTVKLKEPFRGDDSEKAFLLGLRAGDFYCKKVCLCYRMQTSSTHKAQIELLRSSFENYGETKVYYSKNRQRSDEWFIYVDLHPSFNFLLEKPTTIPD